MSNIESKCKDCIHYRHETVMHGNNKIGHIYWCELGEILNIDGCEDNENKNDE